MITIWGSLGIGVVWGWLLALAGGRPPTAPNPFAAAALFIATAVVGGTITFFTDPWHILYFALAALLALFIHLAFLAALRAGSAP